MSSQFGPKTRAEAFELHQKGLLTAAELDSEMARFGEPQVGDVIIPREMRVGDLLEPTFGMGMPWRTAIAERIDDTFVHLARPYARVDTNAGTSVTAATILLGMERYPVELSARHLTYVLISRDGREVPDARRAVAALLS